MMNLNSSPIPADKLLGELTAPTATDWRVVGHVLTSLEKTGRTAHDGEQWVHKVQKRLTDVGHTVSAGHLHKVRRAYNFLSSSMELDTIPQKYVVNAKISSIEIVERLYQLDAGEGSRALAACLDPDSPATAADIKKRYDSFVEQHPEKKNAMHAAWVQRKKGNDAKTASAENVKGGVGNILSELQSYISSMEQEAAMKDAQIHELDEELGKTKSLLAEAEHELSIVKDDLKDSRMKSNRI